MEPIHTPSPTEWKAIAADSVMVTLATPCICKAADCWYVLQASVAQSMHLSSRDWWFDGKDTYCFNCVLPEDVDGHDLVVFSASTGTVCNKCGTVKA